MTVFRNPYFWLPCILFWANQYLEKVESIFLPFLHSYLDDLLAIPVVLGITLQVFRWIHQEKNSMVFTKNQVIIGVLYFGFLFEGLLPAWSPLYVADPWDLACYAAGSFYFWIFINRPFIEK
jgi:hypothetical protein